MAISVNVTETVIDTDVTNTDVTVALTEQTTNVELTYPGPQGASAIVNVITPITNTGTTTEPNIGIDQTLLSLARTQIVGTAVTEAAGKALTAGTADYATLAGTSSFSTNAGTATYATNAGSATTAGTADYAMLAGTAVNISGTIAPTQVTGTAAILGANTFTAQQTITPATSVTALVVNAASSAVGLSVRYSGTGTVNVIQAVDSGGTNALWSVNQGGTVYSAGRLIVRTDYSATANVGVGSATQVGMVIRGATSQTADLQQWQDSGTTVRAQVSSAGAFTISPSSGTALTVNGVASGIGLQVNPNATGSDTARFYHTNASVFSAFSNAGNLIIRTSNASWSPNAALQVDTSNVSLVGVIVQGDSGQTADLQRWQTKVSGTTVMGGRNGVAQLWSGSTAPITTAVGGTIQSIATGANPLVTMASNHNLGNGDLVTLASTTNGTYNGTFVVSNASGTTFNITTALTTGQAGAAGTVSVPAQASITARSAGTVGLVVRAATSQSAVLTSWRDANSSPIASVSAGGTMRGLVVSTNNDFARLLEETSTSAGGLLQLSKIGGAAANPGAGIAKLYFRDGTNANTLKLVVRAGAAGAETTILDNIPT